MIHDYDDYVVVVVVAGDDGGGGGKRLCVLRMEVAVVAVHYRTELDTLQIQLRRES